MGIDVGTGGTRALLIDRNGREIAAFTAPHQEMLMQHPMWAEQEPEDWARAAALAIRGALTQGGVHGSEIRGVGLSAKCTDW